MNTTKPNTTNKRRLFATRLLYRIEDVWFVFVQELRTILHDKGVAIIFFLAGLAYPVLYPLIYFHESINDMPIAVIDECGSQHTREYIRKLDATRELQVAYRCLNLEEAKTLYEEHKVHGVVLFPSDFDYEIETLKGQAVVSVYCDMSSFLYYKNMLQASNFVMLDEHHAIQVHRYELLGNDRAMAETLAQPLRYESVMLYNPGSGYPSFLLPAILILVLFQSMFFGICMLAGQARETNGELYYIEGRKFERSTFRLIFGRGLAYFTIYMALAAYGLGLIPRIFNLPHIGNFYDVMRLMVPFLLSTAFYSMNISVFVRERETGLVVLLFSSVILLFISGVSWPAQNMPPFWRYLSYIFPSTFGINGYIHINSCGATLAETSREYYALWIQTGVYFFTAALNYFVFGRYFEQTLDKRILERIRRRTLKK